MEDKKICPLYKAAMISGILANPEVTNTDKAESVIKENPLSYCDGESCAWYDAGGCDGCSIQALARLHELEGFGK